MLTIVRVVVTAARCCHFPEVVGCELKEKEAISKCQRMFLLSRGPAWYEAGQGSNIMHARIPQSPFMVVIGVDRALGFRITVGEHPLMFCQEATHPTRPIPGGKQHPSNLNSGFLGGV